MLVVASVQCMENGFPRTLMKLGCLKRFPVVKFWVLLSPLFSRLVVEKSLVLLNSAGIISTDMLMTSAYSCGEEEQD